MRYFKYIKEWLIKPFKLEVGVKVNNNRVTWCIWYNIGWKITLNPFKGGGITLNSFYFRLYIKNIFLGHMVYIRAKTCYILTRNLVLLAILIFTRLVSAILYSRYNSRRATVIEDRQKGLLYIFRVLMALITLWSALISSLISRWFLIRVSAQLSTSGTGEILESAPGG